MRPSFAIRLFVVLMIGYVGDNLAAAERPNVVLVMTDDQGIGDFGATGNKIIETPNIDALARRSATVQTFYVSPVCSPTRACLMTGRYNYRTRCIDTYLGRSMMEPAEVTVAEALREAGYATGIFGKWHLGDNYPLRAMDQGFAESLVLRGGGLAQPSEPRENNRRYTDPILFHNGQQVQTTGYCTDVYFDAALKFIDQANKDDRNFFVYLPTNAPHGPYHDVPETLRKHYLQKDLASLFVRQPNPNRRDSEVDKLARIAAMITNVDQNVGRLLEKLDQRGLTENTIVIFLVDNGPNSLRYVGDRRGMKSHVHEGGIRSPLWIQWPAQLKPGQSVSKIAAHIDLMPTILDACGVQIPTNLKLDGRSLLPLLRGRKVDWPDRSIVIQSHRGDQPFRYHHFMIRDDRWKLLHASGFGRERFPGQANFELYDVLNDPKESNNRIADHPEVFQRLKTAYDRWFDDVSSTRPHNYAPPRIHIGTPHENPTVLTRQDWRGGTWARDSSGYWELHVATAGRYDVRLEFDDKPQDETARLNVGGVDRQAAVESGATSVEMNDIELKAGDTRLRALLSGDKKSRGVYQVFITRR